MNTRQQPNPYNSSSLRNCSNLLENQLQRLCSHHLTHVHIIGPTKLNHRAFMHLAACRSLVHLTLRHQGANHPTKLKGVQLVPGLFQTEKHSYLQFHALEELDLSDCTHLATMMIHCDSLRLIKLIGCTALTQLKVTSVAMDRLDMRDGAANQVNMDDLRNLLEMGACPKLRDLLILGDGSECASTRCPRDDEGGETNNNNDDDEDGTEYPIIRCQNVIPRFNWYPFHLLRTLSNSNAATIVGR